MMRIFQMIYNRNTSKIRRLLIDNLTRGRRKNLLPCLKQRRTSNLTRSVITLTTLGKTRHNGRQTTIIMTRVNTSGILYHMVKRTMSRQPSLRLKPRNIRNINNITTRQMSPSVLSRLNKSLINGIKMAHGNVIRPPRRQRNNTTRNASDPNRSRHINSSRINARNRTPNVKSVTTKQPNSSQNPNVRRRVRKTTIAKTRRGCLVPRTTRRQRNARRRSKHTNRVRRVTRGGDAFTIN